MCRTIKILISEAKIQPVFTGREDMPVDFDFSHQGQALVKVGQGHALRPFNFYALIGQNLTGEFMRKIYAAS